MRPTIRFTTAAAAVSALALAVSTLVPGSAAAARAPAPIPCPEGARCGTITVPLDRANPAAGTTRVGYALIGRRDAARPSAGMIAVNPGGPGGSAVAQADMFVQAAGDLLNDHELLLMDPRGMGVSGWLDCDVRDDVFTLRGAPLVEELGRCGRSLGDRARHHTSAAIADDLDDLRARLGAPRLKLLGLSYGTYLMTVYAQRHPGKVDSMVLSGAFPLASDPWKRPNAAAVREAVRRVCVRDGGCDGERVLADVGRLAERLRDRPIPYEVTVGGRPRTVRLDEAALAAVVYGASAASEVGRWGALPKVVREALRGRPGRLVGLARQDLLRTADLPQAGRAYSLGAGLSVICNDYPKAFDMRAPFRVRERQYVQRRDALPARAFEPFSAAGWTDGYSEPDWCLRWPDRGGRAQSTAPPATGAPVLVMAGDLDTVTAPGESREAARQFRNARMVEVPNAGHTPDAEPTGCAAGIARHFLQHRETGDTACLTRVPPVPVER
ncbi:alpha/beta fold hydrolase [Actinomadura rugatobispora]|uniref:Alpha/beta fold hydrolase n=1 Tax=Actinomadura rugatobispora TaxID=1994 RepID=A0ABW1A5Z1_9ACTN|nr:alpha/beta hydrolase [Actinomadura rugatobispora]